MSNLMVLTNLFFLGFWPFVKGVTSVAICVAILYALRRCLRHRSRRAGKNSRVPNLEVENEEKKHLVSSFFVGEWYM